eukprot:SAG11_NODE_4973_length_1707_cov_1.200249_2_plen_203_part_00
MKLSPLHVKPCVEQTDGSLLCMEYAMRRTPNTHLGYFRSQIIDADPKTGHLVQRALVNSTVNGLDQNFSLWPSPLCPETDPCASNTSWQMVTDGNALPLGTDGERGHIMMMYGGTGPGWMNVSAPQLLTLMVVKSMDRGRSETSTPSARSRAQRVLPRLYLPGCQTVSLHGVLVPRLGVRVDTRADKGRGRRRPEGSVRAAN